MPTNTDIAALPLRLSQAVQSCLLALLHTNDPEAVSGRLTQALKSELGATACVLLDASVSLSGFRSMGDVYNQPMLADYLESLSVQSAEIPYFMLNEQPEQLIFPLRHEHRFCGALIVCWQQEQADNTEITNALAAICPVLAQMLINIAQARDQRRHDLYEERATISRELHDSLAQSLTYLKIQATRLQAALDPSKATPDNRTALEVLTELRTNLNDAYRQLRALMTTFRLTMHGKSFKLAVRDSIDEFNKYNNIVFTLNDRCPADILTVDEEMQVLQIIREALYNIVKHARATTATVSLYYHTPQLVVKVTDDGIGFSREQKHERHHGLTIMQERAFHLGGKMKLNQLMGVGDHCGTEISITFVPKSAKPSGGE